MAFMDTWNQFHPIEARLFGGSGPQPNTAAPKWHEVSPGRWEMEGGQQAPVYQAPAGNLFAGMTGGGAPMGQAPQAPPLMTGGPAQQFGGFNGMTGGPGQQQPAFRGMTGGGGQRSSYGGQLPSQGPYAQQGAEPFGGGFRGNFGLGAFR